MKTIKVNYNGRVSEVEAETFDELLSAIRKTLKISCVYVVCPPIHNAQQFAYLRNNQQIFVMAGKTKKVVNQQQYLLKEVVEPKVVRTNMMLTHYSPIFYHHFDNESKPHYSEYISVIFLMFRMRELKNWLKRQETLSPAKQMIQELNTINKKMLDRQRMNMIPVLKLYLMWFNYREANVSKDPERCSPGELLEDMERILGPGEIIRQLWGFRTQNGQSDIIIRIDIREQNLHHLQLHLKHRAIYRPQIDKFTKLPLYLIFWINRYHPGKRLKKHAGIFNFPKVLNLDDMCSRELEIKAEKGNKIQNQLLSKLEGSFEQRYSNLENQWKQWEYQDHYYSMYENNPTNCYNLIGFITQKNGFTFHTVLEARRNEWHRCRNGFVEGISQDEALEGYLDGEETAEILLYRRIYYA